MFLDVTAILSSRGPNGPAKVLTRREEEAEKSRWLLDRRSRRRRRSNKTTAVISDASPYAIPTDISRNISKKISRGVDTNDALRFFLWGPETRQLLTVKEEKELFKKIQVCLILLAA